MDTNFSSTPTTEPIVSKTAGSMYFLVFFLSIFIVVGTGVFFFGSKSSGLPVSLPLMFISVPLILGYMAWKDYKTIEIDGNQVLIKAWRKTETFSLKDIVSYATMQTQNKNQVINHLIFKLTDDQDFTFNSTYYSNYEALCEVLTHNKPVDETLVKRLKKRQFRDGSAVAFTVILLNVLMFVFDPVIKALFIQAKYHLLFGVVVWLGFFVYKYREYHLS